MPTQRLVHLSNSSPLIEAVSNVTRRTVARSLSSALVQTVVRQASNLTFIELRTKYAKPVTITPSIDARGVLAAALGSGWR